MARVIDMRSDSATKPTAEMRAAMKSAEVGDDVHKEDPTVKELERQTAELFGKQAALFVPTGTMGNLASVISHCWAKGQEVIVGDLSHIFIHEQGGISQLGGVHVSCVKTQEDGTFNLEELREKIRPRIDTSSHSSVEYPEPCTALVCLENSHNINGGRVLPLSYIEEVCALAGSNGIPVHMDGARILNASVHSGVPVSEIVKECASVMMCFTKGIGAPVGSAVAGSKEFIERVRRFRQVLGGGMRQAGVIAAAAIVGLETAEERMRIDHQRAKKLAQDIHDLGSGFITCNPDVVETNILLIQFPSPDLSAKEFVTRMAEIKKKDPEKVIVKFTLWFKNRARCVLHSDLTEDDVDCAMKKIRSIVQR